MTVKNYDLTNVSMFYGVVELQGFGEDTAVLIEHDEDDWGLKMGVDGEGCRYKIKNGSATITITNIQSADTNDLLSVLALADISTPGGTGGFPILIKDNNGTSIYAAETAWIQKRPSAEFSNEAKDRVWVLRTDLLIAHHGSN